MRKYITEFIGTLFLVLSVGMSGNPLAIGATLMVMVYAGGHISGGFYNPAVTVAVFVRGKISLGETLSYIGSQIAGALVAALLVSVFISLPDTSTQSINVTKALIAEVLGTFALAYVVLNTGTAKSTSGNSYFGLAIGFTVFAMAVCFGNYSGGAFNPAVAIGASIMKIFAWSNIWIYIMACFAGGIIAGLVFKMNNPDDK